MSEEKQYKTREFPIAFLQGVLWGETEGAEKVLDKIVDKGRWTISHDLVFKYEGQFYSTWYSVGSTEMQDEGSWEYEDGPVACNVVQPTPIVVLEYQPVPADVPADHLVDEKEADALIAEFGSNDDLVCDMLIQNYGYSENPAEKLYLAQILYDAANNY